MEITMEQVVAALRDWLERHNLPVDGVELRVIMPSVGDAHQASRIMMAHLPVAMIADSRAPLNTDDRRLRIDGMPVTFRGEE